MQKASKHFVNEDTNGFIVGGIKGPEGRSEWTLHLLLHHVILIVGLQHGYNTNQNISKTPYLILEQTHCTHPEQMNAIYTQYLQNKQRLNCEEKGIQRPIVSTKH